MSEIDAYKITCACPGDLVSTSSKAYREKVDQAMASKTAYTVLELDLRAARFIDSVGINLIILLIRKMKDKNGSVRLLIANPNLKRVLTFMRVDQHAELIMT